MTCVYVIRFPNGKAYVGVSEDVNRRLREHSMNATVVGSAIRAMDHKMDVVFKGPRADCFRREVELIAELGSLYPGGYNMTSGGEGLDPESNRKYNRAAYSSPEARERQSAKMKTAWADPEIRPRMCAAQSERNRKRWSVPGAREAHAEKVRAAIAAKRDASPA